MNRDGLAALAAVAAAALVLVQDVLPGEVWYHDWRYAAALALVAIPLVRALRRFPLAAGGALAIVAAGLWSGLAGADTETVVGTPGTVVPLPTLRIAAAFAPATDASLEHGGVVTIRLRGASYDLAGDAHRIDGPWVLALQRRPAARVEVRDAHGERLTVTQPQNAAFLSDVLLFRSEQAIRDQRYPLDTFAAPAQRRVVRALYFSPAQLASFRHGVAAGRPALVLTASDDAGRPLGIALASSGETVALAGLRVRAVLGTYPALRISSAPEPWALAAGAALIAAGALQAFAGRFRRNARFERDVLIEN